jgi:hypothetical protein
MLVKYVVVNASGTWLTMETTHEAAKAIADRNPGTHVEEWTYLLLPDGTHGEPVKRPPNASGAPETTDTWDEDLTVENLQHGENLKQALCQYGEEAGEEDFILEYIEEAEHGDGYGYWLHFASFDELLNDYRAYLDALEHY